MPDLPKVADRIKELSYTTGTSSFQLSGSAAGFSTFATSFASGDIVFYAATDGNNYEVGSGIFHNDTVDSVQRFPVKSSNSNALVSFSAGVKEVYATYPATHSVYMASGLQGMGMPANKGVAFWAADNVLNYDGNIIWDSGTARLGINKELPIFSLDVGGGPQESVIRSSGFHTGTSGVVFPSDSTIAYAHGTYSGGRQVEHFKVNTILEANTKNVIELSGVVSEIIGLKKQNEGLFFAAPASGSCGGSCDPSYPTFRAMVRDDYPFLMTASGSLNKKIVDSGNAINARLDEVSGVAFFASGDAATNANLETVSGIANESSSGVAPLSGILAAVSGFAVYASGNAGSGLVTVAAFNSVSGVSFFGSGLNTNINIVSGIAVYSSGQFPNTLNIASGVAIDTRATLVSGIADYASGQHTVTNTNFNIVSGLANFASGGIQSASGGLNNRFDVIKKQIGLTNRYNFTGVGVQNANNPILKLQRGELYEFNINAVGHPFMINNQPNTGHGSWNLGASSGVTNKPDTSWTSTTHNGTGVQYGVIRFRVPMNAPAVLWYNCFYHAGMSGQIQIETPPMPLATSGMPDVVGVHTPPSVISSSLTAGTSGTVVFDSGHIYMQVPSGHTTIWKRAALTQF